jgi:hypothetical protein
MGASDRMNAERRFILHPRRAGELPLPGMPQEKVMANLRRLSDVVADLRAEGGSP